jgi:hypothetical protein
MTYESGRVRRGVAGEVLGRFGLLAPCAPDYHTCKKMSRKIVLSKKNKTLGKLFE